MQEFKEEKGKNENNEELMSEQQKQELAAAYKRSETVRKILIAAGVLIFVCVIFYVISNSRSCTESAMEEVGEPALGALQKGNGLTPIVTVTVKNNSDKPITVMFHCVVYGSDGNKTTTISSTHELIMPGETVKITGVTANIYAVTEFNERCVRISALSYDVS